MHIRNDINPLTALAWQHGNEQHLQEKGPVRFESWHVSITLDKFFKSTVDQWFHESQTLQTAGYIGRKNPADFKPSTDFYLPEIDHTRQNYQLEPTLVNKDIDTADVSNALFYDWRIDPLQT